ncbi:hypothetical protein BGZ61DRAFT_479634 [Ilyonectria robusta]|uniref:uncharacterized protein n=1 Tax=Ilyonectria robusta TaxID=1079257 RepID=UPI001E8E9355|nr:uncharacterized protein BGZ61DRAFT_479634 [Ilyonectria robusta]KAH8686529.1 hypothetical protein BGZ61DRAFT_479634 [Ilyonectria robusta]
MEGLWTDNFENDSNNFNYSGDVSNNEPTLAETAASNSDLEQLWAQASMSLMAADSERVPQAGNHQFLAEPSEETPLPQLSQETDFRSTIHGIGDIPPGDGQVNAEGLFTIDKEPELLDHTVQSGNERSPKDKHTPIYSCLYLSCCNKSFGDKGGLDRHMREVHSSLTFICPVVSCPRNKRGFNKKYNLLDHQKRRHKREISRSLHGSGVSEEQPEHLDGGQTFRYGDNTSESNPDDAAHALIPSENEGVCLRSKLKSLRATRAEIDKDIKLLERALNIISDMHE